MADVTYYIALPFVASDDGVAAGEPTECFNLNAAVASFIDLGQALASLILGARRGRHASIVFLSSLIKRCAQGELSTTLAGSINASSLKECSPLP
jgi:hypothetical protein